MSFFVTPTAAPKPRTKNVHLVALALAAVLTIMVVAQLFTFERFADVLASMWLPGGRQFAVVLAAIIPVLEIAALPFLLSMRLSPAMRVTSMISGWLALAVWFVVMVWQNVTVNVIGNTGLLGATIELPVGWWGVFFAIAVAILAVWAAWGMWPVKVPQKKKKKETHGE